MVRHLRRFIVIAAGIVLGASLALAQKIPDRPKLPDDADLNDPWAYYRLGQNSLKRDPDKAAAAFYWASRLNPVWAEAFYGRRVALLLRDPRRLTRYFRGDKSTVRSKEMMEIDSLYLHALTLNPFLGPSLDHMILEAFIREFSAQTANRTGASASEIAYSLDVYLAQGPPEWRAMIAFREGRYADALALYAKAIDHAREKAGLLSERGRLFYQIGQQDSALVTLTQALEAMRKADKDDLIFLYESKALMEERIGMIEHVRGNDKAAKEAFGRALEEDLSYFPAHVQLAYLGLATGDVATVTSEMDMAVQIKPDDAGIRYQYGYALGQLNRLAEAETQLKKAVDLDPDFPAPHFVLAEVYQATSRRPDALKEIRSYLALSPKNDPRRDEAEQVEAVLSNAQ